MSDKFNQPRPNVAGPSKAELERGQKLYEEYSAGKPIRKLGPMDFSLGKVAKIEHKQEVITREITQGIANRNMRLKILSLLDNRRFLTNLELAELLETSVVCISHRCNELDLPRYDPRLEPGANNRNGQSILWFATENDKRQWLNARETKHEQVSERFFKRKESASKKIDSEITACSAVVSEQDISDVERSS